MHARARARARVCATAGGLAPTCISCAFAACSEPHASIVSQSQNEIPADPNLPLALSFSATVTHHPHHLAAQLSRIATHQASR